MLLEPCLLYTSDAADDTPCVDLGGRRIIKKNIENESGNLTRFLVMGKNISQPEF